MLNSKDQTTYKGDKCVPPTLPSVTGLRHILLLLTVLFMYGKLTAQVTPGGVLDTALDRLGNKYALLKLAVNDTVRWGGDTATAISANTVSTCTSGYFKLYLEPGSGMADTTDATQLARRAVVCRVLYDLSQFVHSPLATSGAKINVWVRNRANVPGGVGNLGYATSMYTLPQNPALSGITDNVSWTTLHSGVDAYNYLVPGFLGQNTFFHVLAAFNFDDYVWHTDLATPPGSSEYDLYTVALREMAHALGIVSELDSNGQSLLGINYKYYTRYDKLLTTHSGTPLITGASSMTGYGFNTAIPSAAAVLAPYPAGCTTDSTNCDTAIQYIGSATIPLYTPNCWERGTSLSNMEDMCFGGYLPANNNQYFVTTNLTPPGNMKRYLKPAERAVLCDIGYATDTLYGDSTNLNFYNYGNSSTCAGSTVAGVNDGMDSFGNYTYVATGDTIRFNGAGLPMGGHGILYNDINADAFEDLQVVHGLGTVNVTTGAAGTNAYYVKAIGETGFMELSYIPVNTSSGARGNMAYIVLSVPSLCSVYDCHTTANHGFIQTNHGGSMFGSINHPTSSGATVSCWSPFLNTPDVFTMTGGVPYWIYAPTCTYNYPFMSDLAAGSTGIQDNPGTGDVGFVGLSSGCFHSDCDDPAAAPGWYDEGIYTQLPLNMIPHQHYNIEMWCLVGNGTFSACSGPIIDHQELVVQIFVSPTPFDTHGGLGAPFGTGGCGSGEVTYPLANSITDVGWLPVGSELLAPLVTINYLTGNILQKKNITFYYDPAGGVAPSTQYVGIVLSGRETAIHNGYFAGGAIDPARIGHRNYLYVGDFSMKALSTSTSVSTCSGTPVALNPIVMENDGALPPDTYTWTPTLGLDDPTASNPIATEFNTTCDNHIYTFNVTESNNLCNANVYDTVHPYPQFTLTSPTACIGSTIGFTYTDACSGAGAPPYTYSWSGPEALSSPTAQTPTVTPTATLGMSGEVFACTVTNSFNCTATQTVTVNVISCAIGGGSALCVGNTITLTDITTGGTWSSSATAIATVDPTNGYVTGITAGTVTITYTIPGGSYSTITITVNPLPAVITGTATVCVGATTTLSDATAGGTWTSSATGIATVDPATGIVTGVAAGTANITYTLGTDCYVVYPITVNPLPNAGAITGAGIICPGATLTLGETVGGGTWGGGATGIATVNPTGVVTGIGAGTTSISYTVTNSCGSATATAVVTVNPIPDAGTITGTAAVCVGSTTTLADAAGGGTWSSSNPLVGSISGGVVTGVAPGSTVISYTVTNSCGTAITTVSVAVNALPVLTVNTNPVCAGSAGVITVTGADTYVWVPDATLSCTTCGNPTVTPTVTTVYTVTGTYSLTGCNSTAIVTVDVNGLTPVSITVNPNPVCFGGMVSLTGTSGMTSYSWTPPAGLSCATCSLTTVTPTYTGTPTYTLLVTDINGCTNSTTATVTVNPLPDIEATASSAAICTGGSTTLNATGGATYTWSLATDLDCGTCASPVATPTASETYTLWGTDINGCQNSTTITITVNPLPLVGIYTVSPICLGGSTTLTAYGGSTYVWEALPGMSCTACNPVVVSPTLTTTYTVTGTDGSGCSNVAYTTVTVNPLPGITVNATPAIICVGDVTTLEMDGGDTYSWTTTDPTLVCATCYTTTATPSVTNTYTATVTGALTGCSSTDMVTVLVNPLPVPTVTATPMEISLGTSSVLWVSPSSSYLWAPSGTLDCSTCESPVATPTLPGTIDYSVTVTDGNGCHGTADVTITVDPAPFIYGGPDVCIGSTLALSVDPIFTGGTWTSVNTVTATVDPSTGEVTGLVTDTVTIVYTATTGCYATLVVTVDPSVAPITGAPLVICPGNTTTMADATPGGSWDCNPMGVASIDPATGIVTGNSGGIATVTYSIGACYTTIDITVNPQPKIYGGWVVCLGATLTLEGDIDGIAVPGTWTSSDITIATVTPPSPTISLTGIVTGIAPGNAIITFVDAATGCGTSLNILVDQPTLNPSPAVVVCNPVNLDAGGVPSWDYTWANPTGLEATTGESVVCDGVGLPAGVTVYTVTATDQYGCTVNGYDTVITTCLGQGCLAMGSGPMMPLIGSIGTAGTTTVLPPGNYYAYGDITFYGRVIINRCVIAIAATTPLLTMYVDQKSDLEIMASHLFSCKMWQGIVLNSDAVSNSATCHITKQSLIEDADTAVNIVQGVMPPTASMQVFSSVEATFNRNTVAVAIRQFPSSSSATPPPASVTKYPFTISNTVFTSRKMQNYTDGVQTYPLVWPQTDAVPGSLKMQGYWTPSSPLLPPYNIDNPDAISTGVGYPAAACKNGQPASAGLYLDDIGTSTASGPGPLAAATFCGIVVGNGLWTKNRPNMNLFDELLNGIYAQRTNLTCTNNAFTHIWTYWDPGSPFFSLLGNGIYASAQQMPMTGIQSYQLNVTGIPTTINNNLAPPSNNIFYDCRAGVFCREYYYVTGYGSDMYSNHGAPGAPAIPWVPIDYGGYYGYDISSSRYYQVMLNQNNLNNIYNVGIFMTSTSLPGPTSEYMGSIDVDDNIINSNYNAAYPFSYQFVSKAIVLSNTVGTPLPAFGTSGAVGQVNINGNKISYVRNGISLNQYNWQHSFTDTNMVLVVRNPTLSGANQQYGIKHTSCSFNTIFMDSIQGPGWNVPIITPSAYNASPEIVGVFVGNSKTSAVSCNVVEDLNTGFQFNSQANSVKYWQNNTMVHDGFGYVLRGTIGQQSGLVSPSDNIWVGSGWYTGAYALQRFSTFTLNIFLPTASVLNVRPIVGTTTSYDPPNNSGLYGGIYGTGGGSFGPGLNLGPWASSTPDCEHIWNPNHYRQMFDSIAMLSLDYGTGVSGSNWLAQKVVWDCIAGDSTIADSSSVMAQFATMAVGSRYAWLTNIENSLLNEDYSTASSQLSVGINTYYTTAVDSSTGVQMADDTTINHIVQANLDFYNLYKTYKTGSLSVADSCRLNYLVNLCPYAYGDVVYKARGLWQIVYDEPGDFLENCDGTDSTSLSDTCRRCGRYASFAKNNRSNIMHQAYSLSPNPNNGIFRLLQQITDTSNVAINIFNELGISMFNKSMNFFNNSVELNVSGFVPGLYLLQIRDCKGSVFSLKFIINQ